MIFFDALYETELILYFC